jgi:hypothetical protein
MDVYSQWRARYRRLTMLTLLPLCGCFVYVLLLFAVNIERVPLVGPVMGVLDAFYFVTFAVNGIRLGRLRCPQCSEYFSRGKRVVPQSGDGPSCRRCGLEPCPGRDH